MISSSFASLSLVDPSSESSEVSTSSNGIGSEGGASVVVGCGGGCYRVALVRLRVAGEGKVSGSYPGEGKPARSCEEVGSVGSEGPGASGALAGVSAGGGVVATRK